MAFVTGYAANDAVFGVLGEYFPDLIFFSDEQNHASMIRGMPASGAERKIFRHGDVGYLEQLLADSDPDRLRIVLIESVSAVDAGITPMAEICTVAKRFGVLTCVDEAHLVGMYGPEGSGIAALGCADQVDLLVGTFANGHGAAGGYVTGPAAPLGAIRSFGPAFIFTLAMRPAFAAGALASVRRLRASDNERILLHRSVALMKKPEFDLPRAPDFALDSRSPFAAGAVGWAVFG